MTDAGRALAGLALGLLAGCAPGEVNTESIAAFGGVGSAELVEIRAGDELVHSVQLTSASGLCASLEEAVRRLEEGIAALPDPERQRQRYCDAIPALFWNYSGAVDPYTRDGRNQVSILFLRDGFLQRPVAGQWPPSLTLDGPQRSSVVLKFWQWNPFEILARSTHIDDCAYDPDALEYGWDWYVADQGSFTLEEDDDVLIGDLQGSELLTRSSTVPGTLRKQGSLDLSFRAPPCALELEYQLTFDLLMAFLL
jgi:hypothetical protein